MKYSIVVPTYNNCQKYLKPCIESILKYTDIAKIELVISANGCTDDTITYLDYLKSYFNHFGLSKNLIVLWNDEPIGFAGATNAGILRSNGDYVVLLNNDTVLLDQQKNQWLEILEKQFINEKCGVSCIIKSKSIETNKNFGVFFCVMISKKCMDTVGLLDEQFNVGGCEDMDFCARAEISGFEICEVFEKLYDGKQFTGGFPIYHVGEGTMHDPDLVQDWENKFKLNCLKLAKKYNREYYKFLLSNNFERAIFLKGDKVFERESTRYEWAAKNIIGNDVLEIGCSTGYGCQFLPKNVQYTGIDYDPIIVKVAKEQEWGSALFASLDVNDISFSLSEFDTIIAFEVIEHLDNGLDIVEKLKKHCKRLLITVPHLEPFGFWGHHHKLHGLSEKDFPGFEFEYIDEHGAISKELRPISDSNKCNLMLCRWSNV